mmetsp:Transcript_32087/g.76425  ORF Transcript_32087/g.76425 Transcript_32087/m.76425 type:complete len:341 (+) Transcript_32087:382-1404(+)
MPRGVFEMAVSRTASTTEPTASRSICTVCTLDSAAWPLTDSTWSPSCRSGLLPAMPALSSTLITGSTTGWRPPARGVESDETSPSSAGVLWWKMMPSLVVCWSLYRRTSRTFWALIEPRGVTPSCCWISSTRAASASDRLACSALVRLKVSRFDMSCSCRFSAARWFTSAVTVWFSRTSDSMAESLSCCRAEYSPICSMYACIFFGSAISRSVGILGGGSSISAIFMAFSILSAVKFCRSSRSFSLSAMPSMRPLISMSSPTADWNLPCTLRRFQDACSSVALSLWPCFSCAASSTAESTTSKGPCPVRSLSPDTLSRSFCSCSFGSVQRSETFVLSGEK